VQLLPLTKGGCSQKRITRKFGTMAACDQTKTSYSMVTFRASLDCHGKGCCKAPLLTSQVLFPSKTIKGVHRHHRSCAIIDSSFISPMCTDLFFSASEPVVCMASVPVLSVLASVPVASEPIFVFWPVCQWPVSPSFLHGQSANFISWVRVPRPECHGQSATIIFFEWARVPHARVHIYPIWPECH